MNCSVREEGRLRSLCFGQVHASPAMEISWDGICRFMAGLSFIAISAGKWWKSDRRGTRNE